MVLSDSYERTYVFGFADVEWVTHQR